MLTIFLLYSNFFAFYALFSPILASPHCSFLLFSCCFFYYYFFVSLYVPVSFASFFLSSSFSFSLSCSVCWQTFREDRNKGRHHCVFTSFPPPPPLLPPPHLFFFSFFGLSEVKFPRLFRLLSPLLLQNDTRAKTTASAKAPSNQTNASSEPDDTTKYIKRVDFWMQKKHARACVCVFLTGRMGAPAVCLCDLVKVLLFYFGGTASFSLPPCHSFTVLFWSSKVMMRDEEKMTKVERCHLVPIGWTTIWTSAAGLANKLRHFKAETTIAAMQLKHSANHQNTGTVR